MVARGAGAAGPVLLAYRQWDPLGLARRLPSLGVGAWRCAPLLPWRAQCPVCVCAALAAGSGGFGPAPGVVSLSFPPPRPACSALRVAGRPVRVSLTLARWYAIPCGLCVTRARSGCPSGSPRVSLSCVCARALAVSAPPPAGWCGARISRGPGTGHWALAQCDVHHAPFLSDPQWPARHVFQAYLRACATKAGRDMPGPKDIDTAYTAFQRQHPRPRPSEHETPNDGGTTQEEPTPSAEGCTPPTILLLAPNGHKHATRTVQRHHAPWFIPKHNAPETDVPPVRHSDQGIPRTCWHCGPAALDTPSPLLHLISTHYHTPTAAATADQQAWLSPWFHTVPPDHPAHVAWTRTPMATWTFTNERADPDSVAIEYDRCDPHRAGPQEAPMRPLQHKCPTLRGDKDDKERRQTITCQKFHPNTGYLFHLMYAYITQGRPDRGLFCLTPRAQPIISQGIGVYAAPLLQPTQITARTAQGNPIYVYHPTAIARLPIPSDTDIIYFTDASGTQQRTPTVGCASVRITRHADALGGRRSG